MNPSPSPDAACNTECCAPSAQTIFVVDWDGTCTADAWPDQGAWLSGAVEALEELLLLGRVKIFSSRLNPYKYGHDGELLRDPREVEADIQAIRAVLDSVGLNDVEIHTTPGKPTGHYYIDNRAIEFSGSWDEVLAKVEAAERAYLTPTSLGKNFIIQEIINCGPKSRFTDPDTGGSKEESQARFDLVPPDALAALARVYGYGESKYPSGADGPNYLRGYPFHLSIASVERHIQKFKAGEDIDPESGLPHLAHAAWHCFTLMAFVGRGLGTDDRVHLADVA